MHRADVRSFRETNMWPLTFFCLLHIFLSVVFNVHRFFISKSWSVKCDVRTTRLRRHREEIMKKEEMKLGEFIIYFFNSATVLLCIFYHWGSTRPIIFIKLIFCAEVSCSQCTKLKKGSTLNRRQWKCCFYMKKKSSLIWKNWVMTWAREWEFSRGKIKHSQYFIAAIYPAYSG